MAKLNKKEEQVERLKKKWRHRHGASNKEENLSEDEQEDTPIEEEEDSSTKELSSPSTGKRNKLQWKDAQVEHDENLPSFLLTCN
jgi:hypothetical protein